MPPTFTSPSTLPLFWQAEMRPASGFPSPSWSEMSSK